MSTAVWFWLLFVVSILFSGFGAFNPTNQYGRWSWVVIYVLLGLLGWRLFGQPVQ
jgi:hypothetical protein